VSNFLINPYSFSAAADGSFYGDLVTLGLDTNLKLCLDAGSSDSYSSGQKWLDLTSNGYDFFLGATGSATTDDPTHNGTPGNLSSSEYWSFDGGDYFRYDTTNETWMENIHKNNALFSLVFWYYPSGTTSDNNIMGSSGGTTGIIFGKDSLSVGKQDFRAQNGGSNAISVTGDTTITTAAWHMIGISIDEATGAGGGFLYLDGGYNQVSASNTFDATYSSPATGSATNALEIGARGGASLPLKSGTQIAGVMAWEGTALTKTNMDSIWTQQKGRFGL